MRRKACRPAVSRAVRLAVRLAVGCGLWAWLALGVVQAQVTEPAVWPAVGKSIWIWAEPRTDLTPEQVESAFTQAVGGGMVFLDPGFSSTVFFAGKIRLTKGKGAARRNYGDQPEKADDMRIEAEWRTGYLGQHRGSTYSFIALDSVRGLSLHYYSDLKGSFPGIPVGENWNVNLLAGRLYSFFFRNEAAARAFIDSVASALRQRGLAIRFSRFGLMWENITPAQAAELGRPGGGGVLVTSVAVNGPADRAGIRPLDAVLEMDGVPIVNFSHFSLLLEGKAALTKASLLMLRRLKPFPQESEWKSLTMELEAR